MTKTSALLSSYYSLPEFIAHSSANNGSHVILFLCLVTSLQVQVTQIYIYQPLVKVISWLFRSSEGRSRRAEHGRWCFILDMAMDYCVHTISTIYSWLATAQALALLADLIIDPSSLWFSSTTWLWSNNDELLMTYLFHE